MKIGKSKVVFIGDNSYFSELAGQFIEEQFDDVQLIFWEKDSAVAKPDVSAWSGDWIFSFKSDLILRPDVLESAEKGAINFHPGPPEYRGYGGYHYALENGEEFFGVTCHHMAETIDYGQIISCKRFPLMENESMDSLKKRAAIYCLVVFYEVIACILKGSALPVSSEKWSDKLYFSKDLPAHYNGL